jgi:N-acetylneuraminic acid mutarotase
MESKTAAAMGLGGLVPAIVCLLASCGSRTPLLVPLDFGSSGLSVADAGVPLPADGGPVIGAIVFGGTTAAGDVGDTWVWSGTAWEELAVAGPSPRHSASMAPLGENLVLFGGFNGQHSMADTWVWGGRGWAEVSVATSPPARNGAGFAPLGGELVLFGGYGGNDGGFSDLSDTWTWDGSSWTEVSTAGPLPRYQPAMATLNGKVVLFGGLSSDEYAFADTWTWDGSTWTALDVNGPLARYAAVFAELDGELVLFGGFDRNANVFSDTWTWNGTAWTQVHVPGPSGRYAAAMTPFDGHLVLFGGVDDTSDASGAILADTWTWDGATWTSQLVPGPTPRGYAVMGVRPL